MELAHAALLRALMAEHGADGEELAHGLAGMHSMFNIRAHHPRRGLRPQGHGAFPAVGKGIHFLLHHIGFRADGAAEKVGIFQKRGAQFTEGVTGEYLARRLLHTQEEGAVFGEKIGKTFNGLNLCHDKLRGCADAVSAPSGRTLKLGQAARIGPKPFAVKTGEKGAVPRQCS